LFGNRTQNSRVTVHCVSSNFGVRYFTVTWASGILSAGCLPSELESARSSLLSSYNAGRAGLANVSGYPERIWGVGFCVTMFGESFHMRVGCVCLRDWLASQLAFVGPSVFCLRSEPDIGFLYFCCIDDVDFYLFLQKQQMSSGLFDLCL
jgi:hypothetical protein